MNEPYYSFNRYLREKFGERVQRISIDAGFGCPNLDGVLSSEGCTYCNNSGFSFYSGTKKEVKAQIAESISYYRTKKIKKFIAYFQAFSNTYGTLDKLRENYELIRDFPEIVGLFISTRPDCIDNEKIDLISAYSKDYLVWVEYGLQTTHNDILRQINRNHAYEDFLKALELARKRNINVGVHIILGLRGCGHQEIMQDAKKIAKLDIQGIKFHVLHILKDTAIERAYRNGKIKLLTKDEYVKVICDFLEQIPSRIVILRLVSSALAKYLVAPLWINEKMQIKNAIIALLAQRKTYQGFYLT